MIKKLLFCILVAGCAVDAHRDIGADYLGTQYKNNPLGEAQAPDPDPLIRFDAFDCVTFVETAIARGNIDALTKIRYKDGQIGFLNRNHFIETDWLANNANVVSDVTAQYCQTKTRDVIIDKQNWLRHVHNIDTTVPVQSVRLHYIPYDRLCEIQNTEPLIVFFISGNSGNYDKIGTDLAVVHTGFLLPGGRVLRHASSAYGRVMDTDFSEYVTQRAKNKNNLGIMLVKIK